MKHLMHTWLLVACGLLAPVLAFSQTLRDPTLPPELEGAGGPGSGDPSTGKRVPGLQSGSFTILVRDGQPSLVVGTRLYVRGQKLGNDTIERISETEVWLRQGRVIRKVPQFAGIERRASSCSSPSISLSANSSNPSSKVPQVIACANDQP